MNSIALAGFMLETLKGEGGLRVQVTFAICWVLQLRATESEMLFRGVMLIWVIPGCPAVTVTVGGLAPKLKSGRFTLTNPVMAEVDS